MDNFFNTNIGVATLVYVFIAPIIIGLVYFTNLLHLKFITLILQVPLAGFLRFGARAFLDQVLHRELDCF